MSLLVFLDVETTGLEPHYHRIIEIAAVVTTDQFEEVETHEDLINPGINDSSWDKPALEMHQTSGLYTLSKTEGIQHEEAGILFKHFLRKLKLKYQTNLHLAGNSVHFDRGFIKTHWRECMKYLHHRQLDVSSVRMLGERVLPASAHFVPDATKPHRAMLDVQHSLRELKHWSMALRLGKHEIY